MLNHVVMIKFKKDVSDEAIQELENLLEELPNKIFEIHSYEFGRDIIHSDRSYDFALLSLFANIESLQRYKDHPDHQTVLNKIQSISENILAVDFMGTEDIYRQLQLRLDLYSMGFPAAKSGIEIKILRYLFSEENARMFLALTHSLAPASSIASSLNRPEADVAAQLEEMTEKGLVFRVKKGDRARYAAIPFVHGLFEFQVKNIEPELAKMIQDYFDEAFDKTMLENAEYFLRTIPVNQSIDVTRQVATYDDAIEILKTKSRIVVTDCICRKSKTVLDECTGCEQCLERCQMEAISMNDDELAQVNPDRCIGCGLCVTTCPVEAITLSPKPDASLRLPPTNTAEQMMLMAQKRGII